LAGILAGIDSLRTKKPLQSNEYKGFKVCLVPVAGMMLIALRLLTPAAQAPSLRSASKLLAQLVEPGCRSRRPQMPNKKTRLFDWV